MRYLPKNKRATADQRKYVYILAKETGEDVCHLCSERSEKGSAKVIADLSKGEASNIIDFLKGEKEKQQEAGIKPKTVRYKMNREDPVTEAQKGKIFHERSKLMMKPSVSELIFQFTNGRTAQMKYLRKIEASDIIQHLIELKKDDEEALKECAIIEKEILYEKALEACREEWLN